MSDQASGKIKVYLAHPRTGTTAHFMSAMAVFKKRIAELPNVELLPHYSDLHIEPPKGTKAGLMAKTDLLNGAGVCELFFMIRGELPSDGTSLELGVAYASERCVWITIMKPGGVEGISPLLLDLAYDQPESPSKVRFAPYDALEASDVDQYMRVFMTDLRIVSSKRAA